jgi:H+/Cl- antiporter ClcA
MWVIKSIGLGLVAVLAALVAFVIGMSWWVGRSAPPGESIGWDPVSFVYQQPLVWVVIFLIFAVALAAGYRHFSPRVPQ